MTLSEHKKAIKVLKKGIIELKKINPKTQEEWNEYDKKKELLRIEHKRLYYANKDFSAMDSKSILIMFRANLTLRTIEFHQFGIAIDYEKL